MTTRSEMRDTHTVCLHPVVHKLLKRAKTASMFPVEAGMASIEILTDGTLICGRRAYQRAVRAKQKSVSVLLRDDLVKEDAAWIAGLAIKDLLAGSNDPIALGAAWASFNDFCQVADRPRRGARHDDYRKQHGMTAADRLKQITLDTFGVSDDQLRRYAKLMWIPVKLQDAFRRGVITLRALTALADQPQPTITAVVADVDAGMSPNDALEKHVPRKLSRPAPRTALRQYLSAGRRAESDLSDREKELMYLTDEERAELVAKKNLIETLLKLPSKEDVSEHLARMINKPKES